MIYLILFLIAWAIFAALFKTILGGLVALVITLIIIGIVAGVLSLVGIDIAAVGVGGFVLLAVVGLVAYFAAKAIKGSLRR